MTTTVDKAVEFDARRLVCGIQHYSVRHEEWPLGADVTQLGGYKSATDKAATVQFMLDNGWLDITAESGTGHRIKRRYTVTDAGRAAVAPPPALPAIRPDRPVPFPDDDVEQAIFSYHLSFFQRRGRWPNGLERAALFARGQLKATSPARRRRAYENLVNDGRFVKVYFWRWRGDSDCYIMPDQSPEYADKHGWLYLAPDLTS